MRLVCSAEEHLAALAEVPPVGDGAGVARLLTRGDAGGQVSGEGGERQERITADLQVASK